MNRKIISLSYLLIKLLHNLGWERAGKMCYRLDAVRYLRDHGAKIGARCRVFTNFICTEPYLLDIGDHVSIGVGVELIPHDGAVWVLRELESQPALDRFSPIKIGNNVFIGNGAKILPGVEVGDNVIIGANSVVTKKLVGNYVYGGIPARSICTLDEYKNKNFAKCVNTKGMSDKEKMSVVLGNISRQS